MESKGKCFWDLLQLYVTWVVLGKNELITLKSGGKAESILEFKVQGLQASLI